MRNLGNDTSWKAQRKSPGRQFGGPGQLCFEFLKQLSAAGSCCVESQVDRYKYKLYNHPLVSHQCVLFVFEKSWNLTGVQCGRRLSRTGYMQNGGAFPPPRRLETALYV